MYVSSTVSCRKRAHNARRPQTPSPRPPRAHCNGVVDVRFPAFATDVLVRVERDIEGLANGLAFRALLRIFAARNSPGIAEGSPAFPLPNRIPSPRKFGILPSKRTPDVTS